MGSVNMMKNDATTKNKLVKEDTVSEAQSTVTTKAAKTSGYKRGVPLALIIVRYFAYVLTATILLAGALLLTVNLLISSDIIYAANFAEKYVSQMAESLESGQSDATDILSCYRWIVFEEDGNTVVSDMPESDRSTAWESAAGNEDVVHYTEFYGEQRYVTATLPNGDMCVLQYDFLPEYTSKALRDTFPDPQTMLLVLFFLLFIAMIAILAWRASHVISLKMRPLANAAANVERQDLGFTVDSTNVREINDVLAAMERMRSSLDESLKAQWAADETGRRQISALAHDLKTPLAIARWNIDLLQESDLSEENFACVQDLSNSIARMDEYIKLLVEASKKGVLLTTVTCVDIPVFAKEIKLQMEQLCKAHRLALDYSCRCTGTISGDETELTRAVMNLADNAVEHAPTGSTITVRFLESDNKVRIFVEDEGAGFSVSALEHGKERFYTDSNDRNTQNGHYGLGLAIVEDIASVHSGTLKLYNREGSGARCVLELPLSTTLPNQPSHTCS